MSKTKKMVSETDVGGETIIDNDVVDTEKKNADLEAIKTASKEFLEKKDQPVKIESYLEKAYAPLFTSKNKGGKCTVCGKVTMYKERTLCYKHYLEKKGNL
ncbi:MAG: hypothetical protein GX811_06925 [Lentisphaerae bacterium]|nr:hypothetical protein [Lentisphaerota bacterium]